MANVDKTAAVSTTTTVKQETKTETKTEVKPNTIFTNPWELMANSGLGSFGSMGVGLGYTGCVDPSLSAVPAYQNALASISNGFSMPYGGGQSSFLSGFKALYDYFFNNQPKSSQFSEIKPPAADTKADAKSGTEKPMTDEEIAKSAKELHDKLPAKQKEAVSEDDIKAMLKDKGLDKTKAVLGLSEKEEADGKAGKTGRHHGDGTKGSKGHGQKSEIEGTEYHKGEVVGVNARGNTVKKYTDKETGDRIIEEYKNNKLLFKDRYYKADDFQASAPTERHSEIQGTDYHNNEIVYAAKAGRAKKYTDGDGNTYVEFYSQGKLTRTNVYSASGAFEVLKPGQKPTLFNSAQDRYASISHGYSGT